MTEGAKKKGSRRRRAMRASARGLLDAVRGILLLLVVLVLGILVFIDIAYIVPLLIVAIGAAIVILAPKERVAMIIGGLIALGGIVDLVYVTAQGGLALSLVPGVP